MKRKIKDIRPYVTLYVDTNTGIAMVEDGTSGTGCSLHPNIDASGSVAGMKKLGYWDKNDVTVRAFSSIHNISRFVSESDPAIHAALLQYCSCGGNHGKEVRP